MEMCNIEKHFYIPHSSGTEEFNTTCSAIRDALNPSITNAFWSAGSWAKWWVFLFRL